jgi:hypothetical protein
MNNRLIKHIYNKARILFELMIKLQIKRQDDFHPSIFSFPIFSIFFMLNVKLTPFP